MRRLRDILLAISFMMVSLAACQSGGLPVAAPADPMIMTPEEVVESFYNWYLEYPGSPLTGGQYADSPYLAPSFIEKVDQIVASSKGNGDDPFLLSKERPNIVQVSRADIEGEKAHITVTTEFPDQVLHISLEKIDGNWMISDIQ